MEHNVKSFKDTGIYCWFKSLYARTCDNWFYIMLKLPSSATKIFFLPVSNIM